MENDTRWARNTPNDHRGTLYIVTFIGFTYSNITFVTRLLIKWHMLGLDDLAMLFAQVQATYTLNSCVDTVLTTTDRQYHSICVFTCVHVSRPGKIVQCSH